MIPDSVGELPGGSQEVNDNGCDDSFRDIENLLSWNLEIKHVIDYFRALCDRYCRDLLNHTPVRVESIGTTRSKGMEVYDTRRVVVVVETTRDLAFRVRTALQIPGVHIQTNPVSHEIGFSIPFASFEEVDSVQDRQYRGVDVYRDDQQMPEVVGL